MTALNVATDIPPAINTVEKLVLWGISVLDAVNPTLQVTENNLVGSVFAAEIGTLKTPNYGERVVCRVSLELLPDWESATVPFWETAKEITNSAVPSTYLPSS